MLTVEQALERLLARARPAQVSETVALEAAAGRVLAEDLESSLDVPPADNSAMDGYALCHRDWLSPEQPLPVRQRITAGAVPAALEAGTAARIFTGAEVPPGADTVVIQERTDQGSDEVRIERMPAEGANIRRRGQDIARGQVALKAGHRLRPQDLGLAASLGQAELTVYRRLRVAVLSSGDELVEPGLPLGPGKIYNSNRPMLVTLLRAWGFEILDLGIVPDQPSVLANKLERAADECDAILSSGGVSVGEEDHVRAVVQSLGGVDLWKVAIKPGKPFLFGTVAQSAFLGLPGNPASTLVTALIIARPYLMARQGVREPIVKPFLERAAFDRAAQKRTEYLRVRSGPDGLECYANQSSGVLMSASWGDGLAVQECGREIRQGEQVPYLPYGLLW